MRIGRRGGRPPLDERLVALADALRAGADVVPEADLAPARAVIARAGERLGHGSERTVVALAGATGSGKSSLFNALVGEPVSAVGVRRPTTSATSAAVWGDGAGPLLDWLAVPRRHAVAAGADPRLDGLVLLDLPDHDSTTLAHRAEVDRVVAVADVVVWVLDPQKYADAAVHEGYLRPLAGHAGVLLVVLNQADRLDPDALAACLADLDRLLRDDGLRPVPVLATSATTGAGLEPLRALLAERVGARRAAAERLGADIDGVVGRLAGHAGAASAGGTSARARDEVVDALAVAAGVPTVVAAVAASHRAAAVAATGWPATRWIARLRPDPLRRLHLGTGGGSAARTSLPAPGAVASSRLGTAVRRVADDAGAALPEAWADAVRRTTVERGQHLSGALDAAVAGTDLMAGRRPRWWTAVGALQVALLVTAVIGAVWLAGLAALGYLRLDDLGDLGTPELGRVPLPTALLLGGVLAGLLVATVSRGLAGVGARRRARRAERRLRAEVAEVGEREVLRPVAEVLDRHAAYVAALEAARSAR